jgi:hypothetical protein
VIDIYGIYNHCDLETDEEARRQRGKSSVITPRQYILNELLQSRGHTTPRHQQTRPAGLRDLNGTFETSCTLLMHHLSLRHILSKRSVQSVSLQVAVAGCWGMYDATTAYLNRQVTRSAIHVRSNHEEELAYGPGGGGGWALCGMRGVSYDRDETADLLPLYPSLVAKLRVTIFSGKLHSLLVQTHFCIMMAIRHN